MVKVTFQCPTKLWDEFSKQNAAPTMVLRKLIEQSNSSTLDNVMSCAEASELWDLSPHYIKNLCREGKVKAIMIGPTWVIDKNQNNPKKY